VRDLSDASAASVIVACVVAAVVAFVLGVVVTVLVRRAAVRRHLLVEPQPLWRAPLPVLFVVLAVRGVLLGVNPERGWVDRVGYILTLVAIAVVGWLLTVVLLGVERGLLARYPDTGLEDRRSRHVRTKIILVVRVAQAVVGAITVAAILWTVPPLRDVALGIFASAGIIGVVVGLAAQTTLGNLFAGLQIAFTDAIRIDDIVVIGGGQQGRIEEITLTYVAVRQSDNTTLILPCIYFTTTPFQNWTHKGARVSGTVEISINAHAPLEDVLGALREELGRVLENSPHWDRRPGDIYVADATGSAVRLIATVTAVNGHAIEPLRREVREHLLTFLQRDHPAALPGGAG
jgi:small-conductance mechanosensitive channel